MFLVRDTTGLRQMTIEGLTGGLNPPGVLLEDAGDVSQVALDLPDIQPDFLEDYIRRTETEINELDNSNNDVIIL